MRVRTAMLAVLCMGLNACASPSDGLPVAGNGPVPEVDGRPPSQSGPAQPGMVGPPGRAEAISDFIVVRKADAVSVLARPDGKPLWSVPQRAGDPIVKARLVQSAIVVVRRSKTAEVYDLKTGTLRFSKEKAGAVGVSWSTLYADSAACQPDCLLRAYDLATGAERWVGPTALPGKVMVELGEQPDREDDPAGEFDGPLRAPETEVIAVRAAEAVLLLDAASGQELARTPTPEAGMALGSGQVLVEWTAVKDCKVSINGRNLRTGETVWRAETGTRLLGQMPICTGGFWRPDITDGLITVFGINGPAKAIEIDTGQVFWAANSFGNPAVALSREAVITYGPGQLTALRPDDANAAWSNRLWAAEMSQTSKVTGVILIFDRLVYTTEYQGSPRGVGWVRDVSSGRRLWYADGARPLGVDGDRVIVETPSGEIRLERMVSTG